ncbi:MAG: amidase, partial [Longimicrobiales bacterium]|nr:amidase [Longimicrobiales bacterium]
MPSTPREPWRLSQLGDLERRDFLKAVAAAAAGGALAGSPLAAQVVPGQQQAPPPIPLGNGEAPAIQFQAYPGGTGALLDKLWRQAGGKAFERTPVAVEPWTGPAPATEEDVAFLPVHRLAALLRAGRITPTELTRIYLDRINRYDPVLLCAVTILEGRALEEAQQAEAEIRTGSWRGPLHGIPYGVKDLFAVGGSPTTWGSSAFASQTLDEDAEVVVRLREAGAVLIAKLATGEFARGDQWYRGRTNNPWNIAEGSSGSSAGPASATAAACVAFAIGTETQGSIVSPARRCGVSALRPTFGRVSRHGAMALSWSMDKAGPICRSSLDCAMVFEAIHGASEKDPASLTAPFHFDPRPDLSALRIGYESDAPESFVQKLRELGADPKPMPEIPRGGSNSLNVESAAAFDFHVAPGGVLPPVPEGLSEAELRDFNRFRSGRDVPGMEYVNAQRRRLVLMRQMAEVMKDFHMFVSGSGQVGLTNQTGHPAAVVPYDFGPRNPEQTSPTTMPLTTTLVGDL